MTERHVEDYLQDILDAIAAIEQFTLDIESAHAGCLGISKVGR